MGRAQGRVSLRRSQREPNETPPPDGARPPEFTAVLTRLDKPDPEWRAWVQTPGDAADIVVTGQLPSLITDTLRAEITARMPGNPTTFNIMCKGDDQATLMTYLVGDAKVGRHRADEREKSLAGAPANDSPV